MRDKDLNDLSALPDMDAFEKYLAVQRLTERIVTIKDSSLLLRDVTVSIRSLGYHLSAESGMLKIAGQEYEALWKTQKKSEAGIISYNHAHHIISYPVLYENGTQTEPPFVIDAVLSDQAIVEQIHATAIQDDAEICFTDKNKQLLFYDGKENAEIFDEYIQQINQGANLPTSELTFNKVLGKKVNSQYTENNYFDYVVSNLQIKQKELMVEQGLLNPDDTDLIQFYRQIRDQYSEFKSEDGYKDYGDVRNKLILLYKNQKYDEYIMERVGKQNVVINEEIYRNITIAE